VSRHSSTPAEANSITLSMPKASKVSDLAVTPDQITTTASMTIQATVTHSRTKASRTKSARAALQAHAEARA
jgi:hypothetical protein